MLHFHIYFYYIFFFWILLSYVFVLNRENDVRKYIFLIQKNYLYIKNIIGLPKILVEVLPLLLLTKKKLPASSLC